MQRLEDISCNNCYKDVKNMNVESILDLNQSSNNNENEFMQRI